MNFHPFAQELLNFSYRLAFLLSPLVLGFKFSFINTHLGAFALQKNCAHAVLF